MNLQELWSITQQPKECDAKIEGAILKDLKSSSLRLPLQLNYSGVDGDVLERIAVKVCNTYNNPIYGFDFTIHQMTYLDKYRSHDTLIGIVAVVTPGLYINFINVKRNQYIYVLSIGEDIAYFKQLDCIKMMLNDIRDMYGDDGVITIKKQQVGQFTTKGTKDTVIFDGSMSEFKVWVYENPEEVKNHINCYLH